MEVEDILERWSVEARRTPSNRLARRVLALADAVRIMVKNLGVGPESKAKMAELLQHADNAGGLQALDYAQDNTPREGS